MQENLSRRGTGGPSSLIGKTTRWKTDSPLRQAEGQGALVKCSFRGAQLEGRFRARRPAGDFILWVTVLTLWTLPRAAER